MKSNVKNELTIPQQTRYLVGIELGKIERHVRGGHLQETIFIRILMILANRFMTKPLRAFYTSWASMHEELPLALGGKWMGTYLGPHYDG